MINLLTDFVQAMANYYAPDATEDLLFLRDTAEWAKEIPLDDGRTFHLRQQRRQIQVLLHIPPSPVDGPTLNLHPEWWGITATLQENGELWPDTDLAGFPLSRYALRDQELCWRDMYAWLTAVDDYFYKGDGYFFQGTAPLSGKALPGGTAYVGRPRAASPGTN